MDRLWTPWRFNYISNIGSGEGCVFCRILSEPRDEQNYVLSRREHCYAILNIFPYTSGHILVVANRHISRLVDAHPEELSEIIQTAQQSEAALRDEYQPDGLNMGFNIGRAAGAGVEHHLHMHVLPRWTGDSNFVSVISETRVLPEELPRTYERLRPHFHTSNLAESGF